ncbi:Caffeic acid 3-O-methyltransferase [Sesamum angolense]|uniref:Caffeic acid 3-O-methyltransferase n=1 Tax=Sesamum angolense TaxID=2727404 RepID=A0AAE2BMQ3_9LAMI|nr:Caffeic acid 3-O-methyltransferase [Sesamum angolense]
MENYKHGEDEEAGALALAACVSHIFPMALDAAIQLDLFEIIARAGVGALLSPSDIASQLPTSHDGAAAVLDSLLRLLATHSLVTCSVSKLENGGTERRYGLAPAGKFFVGDENGVSFAQLRAVTGRGAMGFSLKDAVLEGGNLTQRIHGKSNYELIFSNPETAKVMNDGMKAHSTALMRKTVRVYDGFSSLSSIVDVGVVRVLLWVSSLQSVEHIGGDMFVEVPKGDAILLKEKLSILRRGWSGTV